jgi:hypothetical protein
MNELPSDRNLAGAEIVDSLHAETNSPAATDAFLNTSTRCDTRIDQDTAKDRDAGFRQLIADDSPLPQPNALFASDELHLFRSHWDQVQASFVDEPRAAVEDADTLVASVVNRIIEQFASEREQLEKQWARGEDANTEDLRQTFKRYRAFFDRLLSFRGDEVRTVKTPAVL